MLVAFAWSTMDGKREDGRDRGMDDVKREKVGGRQGGENGEKAKSKMKKGKENS